MTAVRRVLASVAALSLLLCSAACGASSPTAPEPLVPVVPAPRSLPGSLPGVWTGFLTASDCDFTGCRAPQTKGFVLRIAANGAGFIGSFELPTSDDRWEFVIDLTGAAEGDGSVAFTGALGLRTRTIEMRRLVVRYDGVNGLSGTIDVRRFFPPGATNNSIEGTIASAWHQPLSTSVSGDWSGLGVVRTCSGPCRGSIDVNQDVRLTLSLSAAGGAISGEAALTTLTGCGGSCGVPVTGTAGADVSFSSQLFAPPSSPDEARQIESFTASMDALGRLHGRFLFTFVDRIAIAPFLNAYRIEGETLWLTRTR